MSNDTKVLRQKWKGVMDRKGIQCRQGHMCSHFMARVWSHFGLGRCQLDKKRTYGIRLQAILSFPVGSVVCKGNQFHTIEDVVKLLDPDGVDPWAPFILSQRLDEFDRDLKFQFLSEHEVDLSKLLNTINIDQDNSNRRRTRAQRIAHQIRFWERQKFYEETKNQLKTQRVVEENQVLLVAKWGNLMKSQWKYTVKTSPRNMMEAMLRLKQISVVCAEGLQCRHIKAFLEPRKSNALDINQIRNKCKSFHSDRDLKEMHLMHFRKRVVDEQFKIDLYLTCVGPESVFREKWLRWLWKDWFQPFVSPDFVLPVWSIVLDYFHGQIRHALLLGPTIQSVGGSECMWMSFLRSRGCIPSSPCDNRYFIKTSLNVPSFNYGYFRFCSEKCYVHLGHTLSDYPSNHACKKAAAAAAAAAAPESKAVIATRVAFPEHDLEKCKTISGVVCKGAASCPAYFQESLMAGCSICNYFRLRDLVPLE